MEEIKHRQHYVFQAYLKNWTENNLIWCCRNKQKCFQTNTINVAQERNFYRIKDLNLEEERFLMLFIQRQSKERIEIMRKEMEIYKKPLKWKTGLANLESAIESTVYSKKSMPKELEDLFIEAERFTEVAVNDMVEDLHCNDEGELTKMLSMLKEGNMDFYYKPYRNIENVLMDSKCAFLLYVCSQHYRTKAARNRFIGGLNTILDNDFENIMEIEEELVEQYNKKLVASSYEYIFANSKETLERYL